MSVTESTVEVVVLDWFPSRHLIRQVYHSQQVFSVQGLSMRSGVVTVFLYVIHIEAKP